MRIDSRLLLQQLMDGFSAEENPSEKEAILLWVIENKLELSRAAVTAGNEVSIDEPLFNSILQRLNQHEPVQYILGEAEFYGRKFTVSPAVLIPRPETELLVRTVIEHFKLTQVSPKLLDVGTGSGCISITLALELPKANVIATDIRSDSLAVAKQNSTLLDAPVQFHEHDILSDILSFGLLDAVVSNPPYISQSEKITMPRNVSEYEPSHALFVSDSNPLLFYKALAEKAKHALNSSGLLITEINERFGKETAELFRSFGYSEVQIIKDLNGKDRYVRGVLL